MPGLSDSLTLVHVCLQNKPFAEETPGQMGGSHLEGPREQPLPRFEARASLTVVRSGS